MKKLILQIGAIIVIAGLLFLSGLFLGCKTQSIVIPEDTPNRCKAYYLTLDAVGKSDKGFLSSGKKDFGIAGTWIIPCNDAFKKQEELNLEKAKLDNIIKCKELYFEKSIVSKKDADIYLKYVECIR